MIQDFLLDKFIFKIKLNNWGQPILSVLYYNIIIYPCCQSEAGQKYLLGSALARVERFETETKTRNADWPAVKCSWSSWLPSHSDTDLLTTLSSVKPRAL